eukprot:PhM_4_TR4232/c0_g1_i1/m.60885
MNGHNGVLLKRTEHRTALCVAIIVTASRAATAGHRGNPTKRTLTDELCSPCVATQAHGVPFPLTPTDGDVPCSDVHDDRQGTRGGRTDNAVEGVLCGTGSNATVHVEEDDRRHTTQWMQMRRHSVVP